MVAADVQAGMAACCSAARPAAVWQRRPQQRAVPQVPAEWMGMTRCTEHLLPQEQTVCTATQRILQSVNINAKFAITVCSNSDNKGIPSQIAGWVLPSWMVQPRGGSCRALLLRPAYSQTRPRRQRVTRKSVRSSVCAGGASGWWARCRQPRRSGWGGAGCVTTKKSFTDQPYLASVSVSDLTSWSR